MATKTGSSKKSAGTAGAAPISPSMKSDPLFDLWCTLQIASHKKTQRVLLSEKPSTRPKAISFIAKTAQRHYLSSKAAAGVLAQLGYKKSSKFKKLTYPTDKKTRSGELGEILATEFINSKLHFQVPVLKLRWKDGRNLAMRGDDFIAMHISGKKLAFIKGEAKSRTKMNSKTLGEAISALRRNRGRPSPHSLAFVAQRLYEDNQGHVATAIMNYLAANETGAITHHLVFTLSENNPQPLIAIIATPQAAGNRWTVFASLVVTQHQKLIKQVYKALNG